MLVLFTDFGLCGPYVGQMKAVLYRAAPTVPVVDLFVDAPAFQPRAAAYLLAAYALEFEPGTVFLCVVDPGVGDPERRAAAVKVDGRWFVGPDNGLFNVVARRGREVEWWDIVWRPARLSNTFHGRDVFAPVAARLARGESVPGQRCAPSERVRSDWPAELYEVVYIDHYGNALTGVRAEAVPTAQTLVLGKWRLARAATFSSVAVGTGFWYENANGLVEIAVNQGRAERDLGIALGDGINFA